MTVQARLEEKLKEIKDSNQFIIGVLSYADTDENMQLILDFIDKNPDCTEQDISMFAFELYDMREIPMGTKEYEKRIKELMSSG